jgi:transaldolase
VDIATIPTKVLKAMIHHQLTDQGLAKFLADYNDTQKGEGKN